MPFITYLQTLVAEIAPRQVTLTTLAVGFTGFVLAGFWREIHAFKRSVESWQSKIDVTLFGATGDNGLNGTSKDHEQRIRSLESRETCE